MEQIWWPEVGFALLVTVVIQSVPSQLEGNIGEFYFTIPESDAATTFSGALSWCKTKYNSTLAVVNDSRTQTALTQFLNSTDSRPMSPWPSMYINIRLQKGRNNTWFLVNGSTYDGDFGNQDPAQSTEYLLYCHLNHDGKNFIVDASTPSSFRNYICDYKGDSCSDGSANFIIYNGRCFVKYDNESLTWFNARQRCVSSGGDLARFQGDPNDGRIPLFNTTSWLNNSMTYWVGIRWKHLSWRSPSNGTETIFTSWSNEEPNNYNDECVCVDPNGSPVWSWVACDCFTIRQFVCLKRVAVQKTTPMTATPIAKIPVVASNTRPAVIKPATSFTIKPDTIATLTELSNDPATEFNLVIDNKPSTTEGNIDGRTIGLAVGIGGGGLILLIVSIVVLIVIIKRRKGVESSGVDIGKTQNDVYAAVVPNENFQRTNPESSSEIIYTAPVFTNDPTNSTPDKSFYEEANRVRSPDNIMVSTLRGQTKSMYPQGDNDLNAHATEAPEATD